MPLEREKPRTALGPIGVTDVGRGMASIGIQEAQRRREIGAAASNLADAVIQHGAREVALQAGEDAQAVELNRDADGNLVLPELPSGFTTYGANYRKAMHARYAIEVHNDQRAKIAEIAGQNLMDPEKFRSLAEEYVGAQTRVVAEGVRGEVAARGRTYVSQTYADLVEKKGARDFKEAVTVFDQEAERLANEMVSYAWAGKETSPDGEMAFKVTLENMARGVDSGLKQPSEAMAYQRALEARIGMAKIGRVMNEHGDDIVAQRKLLDGFVRDGKIEGLGNLEMIEAFKSPEAREAVASKLLTIAKHRFEMNEVERQLQIRQANEELDRLRFDYMQGKSVDRRRMEQLAMRANALTSLQQWFESRAREGEIQSGKAAQVKFAELFGPALRNQALGLSSGLKIEDIDKALEAVPKQFHDDAYGKALAILQNDAARGGADAKRQTEIHEAAGLGRRLPNEQAYQGSAENLIQAGYKSQTGKPLDWLTDPAAPTVAAQIGKTGVIPEGAQRALMLIEDASLDPKQVPQLLGLYAALKDTAGPVALETSLGAQRVTALEILSKDPGDMPEKMKRMRQYLADPKSLDHSLRMFGEKDTDRIKAIEASFAKFMREEVHGAMSFLVNNDPFNTERALYRTPAWLIGSPGGQGAVGATPPEMMSAYKRHLNAAVTLFADADLASKWAWQQTRKEWSPSAYGMSNFMGARGQVRYVEQAPEQAFPVYTAAGRETTDWIGTEVKRQLKGKLPIDEEATAQTAKIGEDYFLRHSGRFKYGKEGEKLPVYEVWAMNGNVPKMVLDRGGKVITVDLETAWRSERQIQETVKHSILTKFVDSDVAGQRMRNEGKTRRSVLKGIPGTYAEGN